MQLTQKQIENAAYHRYSEDTLNIYTRLKSTGISEKFSKMPKNNLPEYFNSVCDDLKREIAKAKASFLRWFAAMLIPHAALIVILIKLL